MKRLLFLLAVVSASVCAQAVRVDPTPVLTTLGNTPPGAFAPVLAIPGATVRVCGYPATGAPCTNTATTYTDATQGTACPQNAPLVLAGTSQCVATTDAQGNFGFWVQPGPLYAYTVTTPQGASYGPYPVSAAAGGASPCRA